MVSTARPRRCPVCRSSMRRLRMSGSECSSCSPEGPAGPAGWCTATCTIWMPAVWAQVNDLIPNVVHRGIDLLVPHNDLIVAIGWCSDFPWKFNDELIYLGKWNKISLTWIKATNFLRYQPAGQEELFTWIKAIWGWFPLLTMIPVRENSEVAVRSL